MNFKALGIVAIFGAAPFVFSVPVAAVAAADQTMPSCAAGDTVVWENSSTKVYHLKGDKYFGNTKSGTYACKSAADAAGYHASGQKTKSSGAASASAAPDAMTSPDASASPMGKHHHHMKGAMSAASPAPGDTSSPDAMASPAGKHHHHKKSTSSASPAAASPAPAAT